MTEEQLKTIHSLYTDLWRLFKDYSNIEPGAKESVWEQCTEQAAKMIGQYGEDKRPIIIDTLELIERNYKESIKGKSQYVLDPPIRVKEK